jgi:hypothetical protein
VNCKRKSRRRFFLLMRSRTAPISSEFRGEFENPKPPPRYATVHGESRKYQRTFIRHEKFQMTTSHTAVFLMEAISLCDITKSIYRYLRQYTTICLTQFYFARGDMFRLFIQPSSDQLTIEQNLLCAHNMGSHTVYI